MKIIESVPITSWQIGGETMETVTDFIFLGSKITADGDCSHEIKRCLLLGRKAIGNVDSELKSRDITLPTKVPSSQSYGFSSSHIQIWELGHKEGWVPKNWCFWIVMLVKTLDSPLNSMMIKPVNPKKKSTLNIHWKDWYWSSNSWPPDADSQLTGKDPDAGKDWGQEEKGVTEDEMVGWHHWLNGHELEQTPGR